VILIPRLGIAGAAITSSLSYITGAIVVSVLYFMECRTSDRKLNQQLESKAKDNIFPAIAPDSRRTAAYAEEVR